MSTEPPAAAVAEKPAAEKPAAELPVGKGHKEGLICQRDLFAPYRSSTPAAL